MCGSTCFGRLPAHHQEHTAALGASGLTVGEKRLERFTSLLLDVHVWLNMFRARPRPSSGAYNCTRSLWFNRWREATGALLVVVCQTTTNNTPTADLQR
jgi:hypothetical protein